MDGGKIDVANSSSSIDTISILVVDDDITCLTIVSAILKKFNYKVVAVKHPNDALCTLRITGGAFDLVVSDVHMPDMNGYELQQAIAEEFNLPVVLMSADDKEGVAVKGLEGGAAFFIMKPVTPDDLRDLWQFASLKRKNKQNVVIQETVEENTKGKNVADEEIAPLSANSLKENAAMNKKVSKKRNPSREGSYEKIRAGRFKTSSCKKAKIVWTNSLHNSFLEAIRSIGLERAVPKKILDGMNIPGLTRENVASHLQKYRIFLRRVSAASYKVQHPTPKGLSRSFKSSCESSRMAPQSTLMVNSLGNLSYQIPNHSQFHAAAPLPNLGASSSSTQFGQSRLLSNNGSWYKPAIGGSNIMLRHPYVSHVPNSYGPRTSIQGHVANIPLDNNFGIARSASFGAFPNTSTYVVPPQNTFGSTVIMPSLSSRSQNTFGSTNIMPSLSSRNLTYQSNYVGYSLSNIPNFAESSSRRISDNGGSSSYWGITNFPREEPQAANLMESFEANNNSEELLSDIIADYRSMHSGVENGGVIQESPFSPIFDLSEFDMVSAQQAMDSGCFETTLPNQLNNVLDQPQQNVEGETNDSSNLYDDDAVLWDNFWNSFNQTPNQPQSSQLELMNNSEGFGTSSQINGTIVQPINEQRQVFEELANALNFGTFDQRISNVLSPNDEPNDDEFLESLLAPFGEYLP